ncbi:hypothetical protein ACGFSI_37780 [Streptomyces virginiae]|uniref:hypothetical protein n=1 Tax=Streptomyces virginiae TaxID=1961 RepID=UPI003712A27C
MASMLGAIVAPDFAGRIGASATPTAGLLTEAAGLLWLSWRGRTAPTSSMSSGRASWLARARASPSSS